MKCKGNVLVIILFSFVLISVSSCSKEESEPPVVITEKVTDITTTSAISGGNITSDGGGPVTARGVCWNTNTNPTVNDFKTVDGRGAGSFISNLTGLQPEMVYYVKAYATNKAGTTYGFETAFTTVPITPILTTAEVTDITTNSVSSGGDITSDRGLAVTARGVCWSSNLDSLPTLKDPHTNDGDGIGSFVSTVTGLEPKTRYHLRAYATNSGGTSYGSRKIFTTRPVDKILFNPDLTYGTLTDIDNNTYKTIQIGTQTWMAENLKTTRLNDGTPIALITNDSIWSRTHEPAYCIWYNGIYGAIYNFYTVQTEKLCPTGWHVPSKEELEILSEYLGGASVAGGKLKETGTDHWPEPNEGATNSSGFTALPGGMRSIQGFYSFIGGNGRWWRNSEADIFDLHYSSGSINLNIGCSYNCGMTVRCIKD